MAMMEKTSRRRFMGNAALLAGGMLLPEMVFAAFKKDPKYRIAVCDWMILKRQKLGAFQLTKDIGADGVEVDMGGFGNRATFDSKLTDPVVRQQFLDMSKSLNIAISSMAMSGFYAQSFAERPEVEKMVQDCIDTMVQMNIKVAFLPLGVQVDLV